MAWLAPVDRQYEVDPGCEHVLELAQVSVREKEAVTGGVRRTLEGTAIVACATRRVRQIVPVEIVSRHQPLGSAKAIDSEILPAGREIWTRPRPVQWSRVAWRMARREALGVRRGGGITPGHRVRLPRPAAWPLRPARSESRRGRAIVPRQGSGRWCVRRRRLPPPRQRFEVSPRIWARTAVGFQRGGQRGPPQRLRQRRAASRRATREHDDERDDQGTQHTYIATLAVTHRLNHFSTGLRLEVNGR